MTVKLGRPNPLMDRVCLCFDFTVPTAVVPQLLPVVCDGSKPPKEEVGRAASPAKPWIRQLAFEFLVLLA